MFLSQGKLRPPVKNISREIYVFGSGRHYWCSICFFSVKTSLVTFAATNATQLL